MTRRTTQEALEHIRMNAGDEGVRTAQTLIRIFGGIGRGIDDRRVVLHLADEAQSGRICVRDRVLVYRDGHDRERVFGTQGDVVAHDVVAIAQNLHAEHFRKRHLETLDDDELLSGILSAVRQVSYELERRERVAKFKKWVRSFIRV